MEIIIEGNVIDCFQGFSMMLSGDDGCTGECASENGCDAYCSDNYGCSVCNKD